MERYIVVTTFFEVLVLVSAFEAYHFIHEKISFRVVANICSSLLPKRECHRSGREISHISKMRMI